jgi:dipeptidase E
MNKRILALSSSRVGKSGYLEKAMPVITEFLGSDVLNIAFIPFAYVSENTQSLEQMVQTAFDGTPHNIITVTKQTAKDTVTNADAIMVSGGNTFKLLHDLYVSDVLELIQQKVNNGTPYIGWSAGANITGYSICTTNDMPIIHPQSFKALDFFPFQINPHYYNVVIEGYNGETRDERLTEFLKLNSHLKVVCLPEGTALLHDNKVLRFIGDRQGVILSMHNDKVARKDMEVNEDISYLLQ